MLCVFSQNKRRRAKKREEKRANGVGGGRRRRNSSGGSYSSGDDAGPELDGVDQTSNLNTSTKPQQKSNKQAKSVKTDGQEMSAHEPPETKREKMNPEKKAFVIEEKDLRKKEAEEAEEPGETTTGSIIREAAVDAAASSVDIVNEKEVFKDPEQLMSAGDSGSNTAHIPNSKSVPQRKSKNKKKKTKGKQQQVKLVSDGSQDDDDQVADETKTAELDGGVATAGTALKWDEGSTGEHRTQCAFEFSNSLVFDLD